VLVVISVVYSVVILKVEAPMLSLNFRRDGVEMTWGELRIFEYQTCTHNVDNSYQRLLIIQVLTYRYTHK
jgi:hypothetical protein